MKTHIISTILISIFTLSLNAQQIDLSGHWSGKLSLPNTIKLTIVFNLQKDNTDKYNATLDSPDQGAKRILAESIIIVKSS